MLMCFDAFPVTHFDASRRHSPSCKSTNLFSPFAISRDCLFKKCDDRHVNLSKTDSKNNFCVSFLPWIIKSSTNGSLNIDYHVFVGLLLIFRNENKFQLCLQQLIGDLVEVGSGKALSNDPWDYPLILGFKIKSLTPCQVVADVISAVLTTTHAHFAGHETFVIRELWERYAFFVKSFGVSVNFAKKHSAIRYCQGQRTTGRRHPR